MRRQAVFLCLVLMLTRGMQGQEDGGGGELHNEDAITGKRISDFCNIYVFCFVYYSFAQRSRGKKVTRQKRNKCHNYVLLSVQCLLF